MSGKNKDRVPGFNATKIKIRKLKRRGIPIPQELKAKWHKLLSEQAKFAHQTRKTKKEESANYYSPGIQRQIDAFYASPEWRYARYDVLKRDGAKCQLCNATRDHGLVMHVDHIKPLRKYWQLRLDMSNLQVLCEACNQGKGVRHEDDWRSGSAPVVDDVDQQVLEEAFRTMYGDREPPML